MKGKDWFENWLRSKIERETPLAQPGAVWQKIEQRRKKRRRRLLFCWLLGSGLGIVATGGAVFFYFQNLEKTASAAAPMVLDLEKNGHSKNPVLPLLASPPTTNFSDSVVEKKLLASSPTTAKSQTSSAADSQFFEDKKLKINGLSQSFQNQNLKSPEKAAAQFEVFEKIKTAAVSSENSSKNSIENPPPLENWASRFQNFQTQALPTPFYFVKIERRKIPPPPDTLNLKIKINLDWQTKIPFQLSCEMTGGFGTNFLLAQRSPIPGWHKLRQQQERPLDAASAQFLLRSDFGKRFFLGAGIGFWRWTDERRASRVVIDSLVLVPNLVVKIIRHADGSEEKIVDTGYVQQIIRTDTVHFNRFNRFEIPVVVGIKFFTQKKYQLELAAGAAWGFRTPSSGWVASKNGFGATTLKNNIYLQSGTLAIFGRLNLTRNFGKTALGLGVQSRWEFQNMARTATDLVEKRASVGLNFSVRRQF